MYATFLKIFICLLALSSTCSAVQIEITVQDRKTFEPIFDAKVTIDLPGHPPKNEFTNSDGFAMVFIDRSIVDSNGKLTGKLTVRAKESNEYRILVQDIDIIAPIISLDVKLEEIHEKIPPPGEKYFNNRLGFSMEYTSFKNIDEMTYRMYGFVYARRLIFFNLSDLICNGYLDLTWMTNLNSEKTFESEATNTEIEFGRATSYSINYVQSVLLGKGFSLLIETGFQWFSIDDSQGNKLIKKTSFLVGGGFEYNYQRFFVQTNLSAVIDDDKHLGHDLDATLKTGINF